MELAEETTNKVKAYLAKLHKEAEELLLKNGIDKPEIAPGKPYKYTVIGLGSMAHGSITLYSDLEFAILIEGEEKNTKSEILNYFKTLSYLVQLRIIDLGGSIIHRSHYDINMTAFIDHHMRLDSGKKTPLGNEDKGYSVLQLSST